MPSSNEGPYVRYKLSNDPAETSRNAENAQNSFVGFLADMSSALSK